MPQNHLLRPTEHQLMDAHTDITAPEHPVEIIADARGVLWVNIGPTCVLRICRMNSLRIEVQSQSDDEATQITRTFNPPKLPNSN